MPPFGVDGWRRVAPSRRHVLRNRPPETNASQHHVGVSEHAGHLPGCQPLMTLAPATAVSPPSVVARTAEQSKNPDVSRLCGASKKRHLLN